MSTSSYPTTAARRKSLPHMRLAEEQQRRKKMNSSGPTNDHPDNSNKKKTLQKQKLHRRTQSGGSTGTSSTHDETTSVDTTGMKGLVPDRKPPRRICLLQNCGCPYHLERAGFGPIVDTTSITSADDNGMPLQEHLSELNERAMGPIDTDSLHPTTIDEEAAGNSKNSRSTAASSERSTGPIDVDSLCEVPQPRLRRSGSNSNSSNSNQSSHRRQGRRNNKLLLPPRVQRARTDGGATLAAPTRKNNHNPQHHRTTQTRLDAVNQRLETLRNSRDQEAPTRSVAPSASDPVLREEPDDDSSSYWEFDGVIDEVELCRELMGYQMGFEPEVVTDVSQMTTWEEEEDEEENEGLDFLLYGNSHNTSNQYSRTSSHYSSSQHQHQHRRGHRRHDSLPSIPASAAEV